MMILEAEMVPRWVVAVQVGVPFDGVEVMDVTRVFVCKFSPWETALFRIPMNSLYGHSVAALEEKQPTQPLKPETWFFVSGIYLQE